MAQKTQIMLNIVLVICFAFTVTVISEINHKIKKINIIFNKIHDRENEYFERRVQVLNILEEYADSIKNDKAVDDDESDGASTN